MRSIVANRSHYQPIACPMRHNAGMARRRIDRAPGRQAGRQAPSSRAWRDSLRSHGSWRELPVERVVERP